MTFTNSKIQYLNQRIEKVLVVQKSFLHKKKKVFSCKKKKNYLTVHQCQHPSMQCSCRGHILNEQLLKAAVLLYTHVKRGHNSTLSESQDSQHMSPCQIVYLKIWICSFAHVIIVLLLCITDNHKYVTCSKIISKWLKNVSNKNMVQQ